MAEDRQPSPERLRPRSSGGDPLVGTVLAGRFRILALVDRGGMGRIYRAEQLPLGRTVAVKTVDVSNDETGSFSQRFFREASSCARLSHPNTVRIFDYGHTEDGLYFLVMEFLHGITLQQLLLTDAPLEPLRAIRIARQICSAVAEAHDGGVVHRDLKPQNVFLTKHGDDGEFVKVVDFGLVKEIGLESDLSQSGNVLGSPMYMAPEQVEAQPVDSRTDVYAVGLILFYMLTGKTAVERGPSLSVMMQQVNKPAPSFHEVAPDVSVPQCVEWVVQTAIRKSMEQRFCNMREMSRALRACERHLRGEVATAPSMHLEAGMVALPIDYEEADDTRPERSRPASSTTAPPSLSRSFTPPARLAVGVLSVGALGAAALFAVVLIGLGIALWQLPMHSSAPAPSTSIAEALPVVSPTTVRVDSVPTGAEVARDGVVIGNTPVAIALAESEVAVVEIKAPGHEPKIVRVDGGSARVDVELDRVLPSDPEPQPVVSRHTRRVEPVTESKIEVQPTVEPEQVTPDSPGVEDVEPFRKVDEVRNPFAPRQP